MQPTFPHHLFMCSNAYRDSGTGEKLEALDTFTILADLKIVRHKRDGHATKVFRIFSLSRFDPSKPSCELHEACPTRFALGSCTRDFEGLQTAGNAEISLAERGDSNYNPPFFCKILKTLSAQYAQHSEIVIF